MLIKKVVCVTCFALLCSISTSVYAAGDIGKVNANNVNVRDDVNQNSNIVLTFNNGQAVDILDFQNGFYKIADGMFIPKQYIDLINVEGVINAENVNVRALPFEDSQVVGQFEIGDKININAVSGDWFVVNFNNAKAYVAKKFVICNYVDGLQKLSEPNHLFAIVTSDNGLNLRKDKSADSYAVCSIPCNSVLDVIDEKSDWMKVAYEREIGYVDSNYVKVVDAKPASAKGQQVVEYAKQFIGTPYVWGGTNLHHGVDCSGFTYAVMKNFGVNLSRSSHDQFKNGPEIDKGNLQTGDLVFFSNGGAKNIQHVGIYIGNGQFIHSASPNNKGVTISSLHDNYYVNNYLCACRVLK